MFQRSNDAMRTHRSRMVLLLTNMIAVLLLAAAAPPSQAQNNFSSGSTGADGAFAPATNQTIQVPANGIFNFTTVNVPAGVTVTFTRNALNTPVTILASGNVTIAGWLAVSGQPGAASGNGGLGGAGGFDGGMGGFGLPIYSGNPGQGPGGGTAGKKGTNFGSGGGGGGFNAAGANGGGTAGTFGLGGPNYGTNTLLPLIGGSGGGGGGALTSARGASGGGGGGAILMASSGNITFAGSGTISAQGGNGGSAPSGSSFGGGGGGSGGAIRLIANVISGPATLNVNGGAAGGCYNGGCGGAGGIGFVRVEGYDYGGFAPSGNPSNISYASPNPVSLTTVPQLRIASVAGVAAPSSPLGSFQGVPDVLVPAAQANPVSIVLEAANIPVGTVVQVTLTPGSGARTTVSSSALAGTEAASTATASLTLPSGMSVISATAICDLTLASASPMFIDGERVNRIEVAAVYGAASEVTYITQSGRRIRKSD